MHQTTELLAALRSEVRRAAFVGEPQHTEEQEPSSDPGPLAFDRKGRDFIWIKYLLDILPSRLW